MSLTQEISELNNYQIIRKLGENECLNDYEVIHGNLYLTRAFLVQINQGEINLDIVKTACSFWCKRNPLLKAQIFRSDTNKYDRYFVKFKDEIFFEKFHNVEMVNSEYYSEWKEVMDREIVTPFDLKKDPLWRLKILKIVNKEEYNYAFILTSQHSIGDGRNIFTLGIELLNIISALMEDKTCPEMESTILSKYSAESFINSKNFTYSSDFGDQILDTVKRRPNFLGDKLNGQHGKMEFFKIEKDKLEKLKTLMKTNSPKSKLTGVITGLILLSQKRLFERYKCNFMTDKSQFIILASIREKLGIDNNYNGIYSSEVCQAIKYDLNIENFWDFAEHQSISLHDLIKNNFDVKIFEKTDESWEKVIQNKYDESCLNAIISNIGVMSNTNSNLIQVVEHYVRMSAVYGRMASTLFNAISTINGTLCWAITYNEKYFTKKVIIELIDEIKQIINILIL